MQFHTLTFQRWHYSKNDDGISHKIFYDVNPYITLMKFHNMEFYTKNLTLVEFLTKLCYR